MLLQYNITFFILKDDIVDASTPRKASVRVAFIYKKYNNGVATRSIVNKVIKTPIINSGSIKGTLSSLTLLIVRFFLSCFVTLLFVSPFSTKLVHKIISFFNQ